MQTRVFKSGNSQAVRIPKELNFPADLSEVEIERQGNALVIRPLHQPKLVGLRAKLAAFSTDFLAEGRPPIEPEIDRTGWQ
jgi:antitoxin VapB